MPQQSIFLPEQYEIQKNYSGSLIQQLRRGAVVGDAEVTPYGRGRWDLIQYAGVHTLVAPYSTQLPPGAVELLIAPSGSVPPDRTVYNDRARRIRWETPQPRTVEGFSAADWEQLRQEVLSSWAGQFHFTEEQRLLDGTVRKGLRPPQIGALYGVLAHWKASDGPATIVMPTGTGKTETMLAVMVHERPPCLLVVVPTNPLREQISRKFLTFGVLRQFGVISADAKYPIVGQLNHMLASSDEVKDYFGHCNVVVTTMKIAGEADSDVQDAMAEAATHLFIDEAHHIRAETWESLREHFVKKRRAILQFTATPFRADGKHVDGKVAFSYPLRKAQDEQYFKPIRLRSVLEFDPERADAAIARAAIEQLSADRANGYDHLIMARADNIPRAEKLHAMYVQLAPELHPLLIHSGLGSRLQRTALADLSARRGRIIVCVGMLGEGFDLPELKIAALHDPHKSLAITLQFTGRFTRGRDDLGDATMVANVADPKVNEALKILYSEDADWNAVLRELAEGAVGEQAERAEFLEGFGGALPGIALQNIFPKMSTVVYRTTCNDWTPLTVPSSFSNDRILVPPVLNARLNVVLFVTREAAPIPWGRIKEVEDIVHHLYLAHWDRVHNLLFIHSSNNESLHGALARAYAGDEAQIIEDEQVFRCMDGLYQLILMNIGLSHSVGGAVRFSMHMGSDVSNGLAEALVEGHIRTNVFGRGYENGHRASVGVSRKGRIWSHSVSESIPHWLEWCARMGEKIRDDTITADGILRRVLVPKKIAQRPHIVPITIEWPEEFYMRDQDGVHIEVAGETRPFYEVGLDILYHSENGPLTFRVSTETRYVDYEIRFVNGSVEYIPLGMHGVYVYLPRKNASLGQWFLDEPPLIRFADGSFLVKDKHYEPYTARRLRFDPARIAVWDWHGVEIKKESQYSRGLRRTESIQYRVIQELINPASPIAYDFVLDDDNPGEAADVVAIAETNEELIVHLFHCKFSKEENPGARVDDLYAVCGQAQRSVHWRGMPVRLLGHLLRRESKRQSVGGVSRLEKGTFHALQTLARKASLLKPIFKIFIVQPGLSAAAAGADELELLGATEIHLKETYQIPLEVIASA